MRNQRTQLRSYTLSRPNAVAKGQPASFTGLSRREQAEGGEDKTQAQHDFLKGPMPVINRLRG